MLISDWMSDVCLHIWSIFVVCGAAGELYFHDLPVFQYFSAKLVRSNSERRALLIIDLPVSDGDLGVYRVFQKLNKIRQGQPAGKPQQAKRNIGLKISP